MNVDSRAFFNLDNFWTTFRIVMPDKQGRANKKIERRPYGNDPPQLAVEIFKRNLRSIVALAKENRIKVILGNQPLQPYEEYFILHMDHKPYNSVVTYPLQSEFVNHHKTFNRAIKQVAEETGVFFIDNAFKLGENKE